MSRRALEGVRVLELGQLIAGPFAGTLLGYFGAQIIKVEPPGGDPLRNWRQLDSTGTSLWWYSLGRNKQSIAIDLKTNEGRELIKRLAKESDVLIENFRPGKMESWGLGPQEMEQINNELIYCRISGYGQTGTKSSKTGFASVCEAYSGFRHVNGFPGKVPVRPNLSVGDSMAGIHAALGITVSLIDKLSRKDEMDKSVSVVDVSIFEAMLNLQEAVIPEYDRLGEIRGPSGSTVTGIVPTGTYESFDGKYVVIGGNGDSIFRRLMNVIGHEELGELYDTNEKRVKKQQLLDGIIESWTKTMKADDILKALDEVSVPAGLIYSVKDMFDDDHYHERGVFESVSTPDGELRVSSLCPKLPQTPGKTASAGPTLGQHTDEILSKVLAMNRQSIESLRSSKIIM